MKKIFGDYIKEKRLSHGLGLRKAAFLMKINPGYLSNLENSKVDTLPSLEIIKRISKILNIEFKDLHQLVLEKNIRKPINHSFIKHIHLEDMKVLKNIYIFAKKNKYSLNDLYKNIKNIKDKS